MEQQRNDLDSTLPQTLCTDLAEDHSLSHQICFLNRKSKLLFLITVHKKSYRVCESLLWKPQDSDEKEECSLTLCVEMCGLHDISQKKTIHHFSFFFLFSLSELVVWGYPKKKTPTYQSCNTKFGQRISSNNYSAQNCL